MQVQDPVLRDLLREVYNSLDEIEGKAPNQTSSIPVTVIQGAVTTTEIDGLQLIDGDLVIGTPPGSVPDPYVPPPPPPVDPDGDPGTASTTGDLLYDYSNPDGTGLHLVPTTWTSRQIDRYQGKIAVTLNEGGVMLIGYDGSTHEFQAADTPVTLGGALWGDYWWYTTNTGKLARKSLTVAEADTTYADTSGVYSLASDADWIYYLDYATNAIYKQAHDGTGLAQLATTTSLGGTPREFCLRARNGYLYALVTATAPGYPYAAKLVKIDPSSGAVSQVSWVNAPTVYGWDIDSSEAWYSSGFSGGVVTWPAGSDVTAGATGTSLGVSVAGNIYDLRVVGTILFLSTWQGKLYKASITS